MALARKQGRRVLRWSDRGARAAGASKDARRAGHVRHVRRVNEDVQEIPKGGAAWAAHMLTLQKDSPFSSSYKREVLRDERFHKM